MSPAVFLVGAPIVDDELGAAHRDVHFSWLREFLVESGLRGREAAVLDSAIGFFYVSCGFGGPVVSADGVRSSRER